MQGTAIAKALVNFGAEVIFVTGPVNISSPKGAEIIEVVSAQEMFEAVEENGPYDVAICAAAVSDWRLKETFSSKVKKETSEDTLSLDFVKNRDILAYLGNFCKRPKLIIGFAAETDNLLRNAKKKLKEKNCDWILGNDVSLKSGVMGKSQTEITFISKNETKSFPRMSKDDFANLLVERIVCEIE